MSDPTAYVPPQSLAAVPVFVKAIEIDADAKYVRKRDWEEAASQALDASIHYDIQVHGGRYFDVAALSSLADRPAFPEWAAETLLQISYEVHERRENRETKHHTVSQWRYRYPGLDAWRNVLRADYVLISLFLDGQNTTGRSLSNALAMGFGGWVIDARREGVACVVNLIDGRVVWCELREFEQLSVREREGAQRFVDLLTAGLFAMKQPAETLRPSPTKNPAPPSEATPSGTAVNSQ